MVLGQDGAGFLGLIFANLELHASDTRQDILRGVEVGHQDFDACGLKKALHHHGLGFLLALKNDDQRLVRLLFSS